MTARTFDVVLVVVALGGRVGDGTTLKSVALALFVGTKIVVGATGAVGVVIMGELTCMGVCES